jgi:hypothetical protein
MRLRLGRPRRSALVLAAYAFAVCFAASAFAQDWIQFASQEDRFSCVFPQQPTVSAITWKSEYELDLPGRVYSVESGPSRYSVTVVDYGDLENIHTERSKTCIAGDSWCRGGASTGAGHWKQEVLGAMAFASGKLLQRDAKVLELISTWADQIEGMKLRLANADKTRTHASIYMHQNKLYIVEATVPAGYPESGLFEQSIGWFDEKGNSIRYTSSYRQGYPVPPRVNRTGREQ